MQHNPDGYILNTERNRLRPPESLSLAFCYELHVIMGDVAYCDLCEMDQSYCVHGLAERRRAASASAPILRISPSNIAHFPHCPHKGDDPDYSRWAELDTPNAWQRLGNGEQLRATGGQRPDLIAKTRCEHCVDHGPW